MPAGACRQGRPGRGRRRRARRLPRADGRRAGAEALRRGLLRARAARRHAQDHRRRLTEAKQTIPHFYLTLDCEIDALLTLRAEINAAAPEETTRATCRPTSSRSTTWSSRRWRWRCMEVPTPTSPGPTQHGPAPACRRRRRRGDPGRPDHAGRQARREEDAVGDLQRDEGPRRPRPRPQAEARGVPGRHLRGVQPRHVRHQELRRRDQPAARDHPGGRRRRGAAGRARRAR